MPEDDSESSSEDGASSYWSQTLIHVIREKKDISEEDRIKEIEKCLNKGAEIDTVDTNGNTALYVAVKRDFLKIVHFLIGKGAKTDVTNSKNQTALTLAETRGNKDILNAFGRSVNHGSYVASQQIASTSQATSSTGPTASTSVCHPNMVKDSPGSSKRKSTADNEDSEHGKKQRLHTAKAAKARSSSQKDSQSEDDTIDEGKTYAALQGLKNTLHGNIYQLKLLMLFLWRGLREGYSFRLATEMDKAEKFDDLVFEYSVKTESKPFYQFLQAKHKLDENKKISARDLLTESKTDDDFSLQKYFISYRKIKNHSEFKSEMRKDFIICTNIDFDSKVLASEEILPQKVNGPDDFLNIESETKESARYKLCIKEESEPWKILKRAADVHQLAKILVDHVFKSTTIILNNDLLQLYHTALVEEVIDVENRQFFSNFIEGKNLPRKVKKFREIFCAEVSARLAKEPKKPKKPKEPKEPKEVPSASAIWEKIEERPLKVSSNFGQLSQLSTDCTPESLAEFSKELVELISNADENYLVKVDPEKYKEDAKVGSKERVFADNINKLGGHMLIRNDEKIKFRRQFLRSTKLTGELKLLRDSLETGLGTKYADLGKYQFDMPPYFKISDEDLPVDEVNDEDIEEFLKNLIFAVNQPNEIELGDLINSELGADNRFNLLTADLVGASFQKEILDWFKEKGKKKGQEGRFYSREDAEGFFESIKEKVDSVVNLGLSLSYREELKGYGIKFAEKNQELENFLKSDSSDAARSALNLFAALDTLPTAIRVQQAIQEFNSYERDGSLMFLRLRTMQSSEIEKRVTLAFRSLDSHHLLVIDCESATEKEIQKLYNRLRQTMEKTMNEMIEKRTETTMKKNHKKLIFITRNNEPSSDRPGILLDNCRETCDNVSFKHLRTVSQLKLVKKEVISFQGYQQRTSFRKLLDISGSDDIVMQDLRDAIDTVTLVKLIQDKAIEIGSDLKGLGEIKEYYIPRTINSEVIIKNDILKSHSEPDVLDVSHQATSIVPKFSKIIFERGSEAEEFKKLCDKSKKNVHWLTYESGKFSWHKSRGDITFLTKYRDVSKSLSRNDYDIDDEAQLAAHDYRQKVVIFSDSAGNGKTTMFTSLAKEIKAKNPGYWVMRLDLNDFTEVLGQELLERSLNGSDSDKAIEFFVEKLSKLETKLDKKVLKTMMRNRKKVALLFDEFDEIGPKYTDVVINLLQGLKDIRVEKLFVATRPHMRKRLEDKLGTFSYIMEEFSEKNQIDYLIRFWKAKLRPDRVKQQRLKPYAKELLRKVVRSIGTTGKAVLRVPVQLQIIAELYTGGSESQMRQKHSETCEEYLRSENKKPNIRMKLNAVDLYESIVEQKFNDYFDEKMKCDRSIIAMEEATKKMRKTLFENYQKLAWHTLFKVETSDNSSGSSTDVYSLKPKEIADIINEISEGKERIGIITDIVDGRAKFEHRTFAEYFAATFIFDTLLKQTDYNQDKERFFDIEEILSQPQHEVIRAFLNGLMGKETQQPCVRRECKAIDFLKHDIRDNFIFHTAAYEKHYEIIKFLLNRIDKPERRKYLITVHPDTDRSTVLRIVLNQQEWKELKWLIENGSVEVNSSIRKGHTVLHAAAFWDNLDMVQWLVKKGADLRTLDKYSRTPVHATVQFGELSTLEWLVDEGKVNINDQNKNGKTLLHYAASAGRLDMVKWLVNTNNADLSIRGNDGNTALHEAAHSYDDFNEPLITPRLVRRFELPTVGKSGDYYSISDLQEKRDAVVRWLIRYTDVDVNIKNVHGETILSDAVRMKRWDDVKFLVEKKNVSVNAVCQGGRTVLLSAASDAEWDLVKWLLEDCRGADVHIRDNNGMTVLHYAAASGQFELIKRLVTEKGCEISVETGSAMTLLHDAALSGVIPLIEWLVKEKRMNVEARNDDGKTLLQVATDAENWDMVKALAIACNVDMNAGTEIGDVVLLQAVQSDNVDMIQWLVNHKNLNVDAKLADGRSILHEAVKKGSFDVVEGLITEMEADPNKAEYEGWPILHAALLNNNYNILDLLLRYSSANKYAQDKDGNTFLRLAANRSPKLYERLLDEYDFKSDIEDVVDENETSNFSSYAMKTEDADIQADEFPS